MIDPQSETILQDILRRESRSLLSYIGDAYPWAAVEETELASALEQTVLEERAAVADLGRFLVRHKVTPPPLTSYPASFTTSNFIALDFLLKRLLEAQLRSIAELRADLGRIHDKAAHEQIERLLATKQKTLEFLQKTPSPATQGRA